MILELPEVETICRVLNEQINGSCIDDVVVYNSGTLEFWSVDSFTNNISHKVINSITRKGKYVVLNVNGGCIYLRIRVNGQIYVTSGDESVNRYSLINFILGDGRILHLDDVSKFAKAYYVKESDADVFGSAHRLGLDPFDDGLTAEYLKKRWGCKTGNIKSALLEQDVVAGFGDFYSDELLFKCGIHPEKKCEDLSDDDFECLAKNIPIIMQWGINNDKVSPEEYDNTRGTSFNAIEAAHMYGRKGKPCERCGTVIERTEIGGRTCCYCPVCQPIVRLASYTRSSDITPEMLAEVAQYIGAYISTYGHFETYVVPDIDGEGLYEGDVTWEEFVGCAHRYITDPSVVNKDYGNDAGEQNATIKFVISKIDTSSFYTGIKWIKSQKWKES